MHRISCITALLSCTLPLAAVTIDIAAYPDRPVAVITPKALGAHLGGYFLHDDWPMAQRRFPAHGLTDGALLRHFTIPPWVELEVRDGRSTLRQGMSWWDHVQSSDAQRRHGSNHPFMYLDHDVWQLLEATARLRAEALFVTPGFPNQTRESAAAFVAFCNGAPGDPRPIGTDRLGRDWRTVGHWASIRAAGDARHPAHPEPYHARWFELGNELYYPSGPQNPPGTWLNLDDYDNFAVGRDQVARATHFVEGRTVDGVCYDGYAAYHDAMKQVDPTIRIAPMLAPGHGAPWHHDWTRTVLALAKDRIDFVTIHTYPNSFGKTPEQLLERPLLDLAEQVRYSRTEMRRAGLPDTMPLIVSEWHSHEPSSPAMQQMQSALMIAEGIGRMLENGADGQCLYGPFDTRRADGSWATMVRRCNSRDGGTVGEHAYDRPAGFRWPGYYAFAQWTGIGDRLIEVRAANTEPLDETAVFAASGRDQVTILVINKQPTAKTVRLVVRGGPAMRAVESRRVTPRGGSLTDEDVCWNEQDMSTAEAEGIDDLEQIPPISRKPITGNEAIDQVAPYSITRFRFSR